MKLLGDAALVNGFWVCLEGFVLTRCGHIDVTIAPCLRGLVMQSQTLFVFDLVCCCLLAFQLNACKRQG